MIRSMREQLPGTWFLDDYLEIRTDGQLNHRPFGEHPKGVLIYTADGDMSVQLMKVGRPTSQSGDWLHGTPDEYREQASGYLAYAGTYEVDEEEATVTHIVSISLFPDWIGHRQKRRATLKAERLTLETAEMVLPDGVHVVAQLQWKKARAQAQSVKFPDQTTC